MTHSPVQGSAPLLWSCSPPQPTGPAQGTAYSYTSHSYLPTAWGGSPLTQGGLQDDTSRDPFSHTRGPKCASRPSLSSLVLGSRLIRHLPFSTLMSLAEPVGGHTLPSKSLLGDVSVFECVFVCVFECVFVRVQEDGHTHTHTQTTQALSLSLPETPATSLPFLS